MFSLLREFSKFIAKLAFLLVRYGHHEYISVCSPDCNRFQGGLLQCPSRFALKPKGARYVRYGAASLRLLQMRRTVFPYGST